MSYPWIKDSQYGTTPSVTGYLEVTSPKGLYLTDGSSNTIISSTSVTATTFTGALSGNASTATSIAGGLSGQILYQSKAGATDFVAVGTTGQFLQSNATGAPSWVNQNLVAIASGIPASGATQSATLRVNFNNSFSSVTRYEINYTSQVAGTSVYTINNYALSNGLSGGQYTLVIAINIPGGPGVTYTFNGSGFSLTPKFNFTTITTGNVNVSTTRYIVLTFAYDGTNYFMSGSNFT